MKQSKLGATVIPVIFAILISNCSPSFSLDVETTATVTPTTQALGRFMPEPTDTPSLESTATPSVIATATVQLEPTISLTVSPALAEELSTTDIAKIVLEQTAQLACPVSGPGEPDVPEVSLQKGRYSFNCTPAAGHSTSVWMEQFATQTEAETAFNATRGNNPVQDFHSLPLSAWQEQHPSFPGGRSEYSIWTWQADRWLITVRAFDDTHFLTAPAPQTVSEAIYRAAVEHALFPIGDN